MHPHDAARANEMAKEEEKEEEEEDDDDDDDDDHMAKDDDNDGLVDIGAQSPRRTPKRTSPRPTPGASDVTPRNGTCSSDLSSPDSDACFAPGSKFPRIDVHRHGE